jgi:hypothetical protein
LEDCCTEPAFESYAFGFLHVSKQPEAAVVVLHNDVLLFHEKLGLSVGAVLTDNGHKFCGTDDPGRSSPQRTYGLILLRRVYRRRLTKSWRRGSFSVPTEPIWRMSVELQHHCSTGGAS